MRLLLLFLLLSFLPAHSRRQSQCTAAAVRRGGMAASACVDRADIEAQLGASSSADEPEIVFREIRHADIAELQQLQRVLFPVQYSDTFYQRLFTDGYYTIVGVTVPDGELVAVASVRTVQHSDEVRDSGLREVWPAVRTAFTSLVPVSSQQPPRSRAGVHYDAGRQGAPLRPTPSLRSASTMVSSSPAVAGDVPTAAARDACDAGVPRSDTRAGAMRRAPHHAPRSSERACASADPRLSLACRRRAGGRATRQVGQPWRP